MADPRPRPTVVLVGMMGAGKTAVGRALARRTGWRYQDNDALIQDATGRAPEEIDATDGSEALHRAEAEALRQALSMPPPLIVGAAAWVVADPDSVERLRAAPDVVYLRARPETLRRRIGAGQGRRLDATDPDWLRSRFRERDETYRAVASLTIDTDELGVEACAARIGRWLRAPVRESGS